MAKQRRKRKQNNLLPVFLIGGGILLVVAVLIYGALSGRAGQQVVQGNIPFPEIERVSLTSSKAAYDQQQAVFLDVRSADQYQASHIPGAVHIPVTELENRLEELDPNQWIITYCT